MLTTQDGGTGPSSTALSSMIILPRPTSPLIPDSQELCIMFTRAHLDPSGPIDTSLQALLRLGHRTSSTTQHYSNTSTDITTEISTCHLTAAHSFALLFFSKSHNLPSLTHQGLQTHSQTLRTLQRLLANPQCWKHDEILITVTTLAVQETLAPTTTTLGPAGTYMNHMLGLDRLLSLRDARQFVAPPSLELYKCLRHLLIFACLQARRRSVFAREDWKAVMRLACRTAGLEVWEQGVYEVLAACSVLRVERDEMLARLADHDIDGADVAMRGANLARRAMALHAQLHNWKAQWDAEPTLCYTESYPHPSPDSTAHTYTHAYPDFIFPTRHHAQLLILYNTTLIYILDLLSSSTSTPISSSNPNPPSMALDPQTRLAVLQICQSMPDYSSGDGRADIHASPVAIWAMQLIVPMLRGDGSAEAKGMLGMLRRKGGTVLGSGLV